MVKVHRWGLHSALSSISLILLRTARNENSGLCGSPPTLLKIEICYLCDKYMTIDSIIHLISKSPSRQREVTTTTLVYFVIVSLSGRLCRICLQSCWGVCYGKLPRRICPSHKILVPNENACLPWACRKRELTVLYSKSILLFGYEVAN